MELFPPSNLPGVGMGSALSIVGIGGLLGLATTSGAMLSEGIAGVMLWEAAGIAALEAKPDQLGGRTGLVATLLVVLLMLGVAQLVLARRAHADTPSRAARMLGLLCVVVGSAAAGIAWSEWNELPITLGDAESIVGLVAGVIAGAVGGHAAWLFTEGSVRGGGARAIVTGTVLACALAANALSVYVPFAGFVVLVLAAVLAWRLQRRARDKYKGLRILA